MSLLLTFHRWLAARSPRSCRRLRRSIPVHVQSLEPRALLSGVPAEFVDPHPQVGNQFGATVTVLTNGNVVIAAPNDDAGGGDTSSGTGAGAVYLFNGQTGARISTLTGSSPGDQIGNRGVTALSNGNFVIDSNDWNGGRGAVTWGSGTSGVTAVVSATNSLVGSTAGDLVGYENDLSTNSSGVTALSNGNYVVDSPYWNGIRGAVTWGSGASGVTGVVSATNSLVGSVANDYVGSLTNADSNYPFGAYGGVTLLNNGNYVVVSSSWNGGMGAVTWGSGTTGVTGAVSPANSLVGSFVGDHLGYVGTYSSGITPLNNGNYVINSPYWNGKKGASTWGSGTTGVDGTIGAANSLVGSTAGDRVGIGSNDVRNGVKIDSGTTALSNGNYVVDSSSWNGNRGAVTWGSGTTGVTGAIGVANSLVGTIAGDQVGFNPNGTSGVTALNNGNYVVGSSYWNGFLGAATWGSGTTGVTGMISVSNSLVGSSAYDRVGENVTALTNGNYVVDSPSWGEAGAATWGSGTSGVTGVVSASNSLVGYFDDQVGAGGVIALTNGNYVVDTMYWTNTATGQTNVGAVTWGDGTKGVVGAISAANSLVGTSAGDKVGLDGVTALANGNYVVTGSYWHNNAGEVTWGNGATGTVGAVNSANSLVGSASNASVGSGGVTALTNGNYVVYSSTRRNSSFAQIGAVTWGNGTTGMTGTISAANSLVETTADSLPYFGTPSENIALSNGNYVVDLWYNGFGAVAFGNGSTGINGAVSSANSLFGQTASSNVNPAAVIPDHVNGVIYAAFPLSGSGHVYRGLAAAGFSTGGPSIGVSSNSGSITNVSGSLSLGATTLANPVTQTITVSNNGNTPLIVQPVTVPAGFSVLNNFTANESIAAGGSASFTLQLDATTIGSYSGLVTIGDNDATASPFRFTVSGTVSAAVPQNWFNFADPHPEVGNQFRAKLTVLSTGNVIITSPNDDAGGGSAAAGSGAGAIYLFNGQTGSLISTLTGSSLGDHVGANGVITLGNGNYLIDTPNWTNGTVTNAGAVTFGNGTTGVAGVISAANSLIGSIAGDQVGYIPNGHTSITVLNNGNYVIGSPFWNNTLGAVTWGSGAIGVVGVVSAANSLIGSGGQDYVGLNGITALTNGNYIVNSSDWGGLVGASTWADGTKGITGFISAANSLVGSSYQDFVGQGAFALSNGNYIVESATWNGNRGAATWGDGTKGITGTVSATNSLVGSTARDLVGVAGSITALTNGNYVVDSYSWNGGRGAVTWGSGTTGVTGVVSSSNSLVGSTAGDQLGVGYTGPNDIIALSDGNYVVDSPDWNSNTGAVTWGSGTAGVTGVLSAANSLVGSTVGDEVGFLSGVKVLSNGNYVVDSLFWNGSRGAVTWGSAANGVTGIVSAANSLIGTAANDRVGESITLLNNGNYVASSTEWNGDRGEVTWGSGTTGVLGEVSAANSLIGSASNDILALNGITALTNGNYVVDSPHWNNAAGAVTWGDGTKGVTGTISAANSLIGSGVDLIGYYNVTALTNGNYVVDSPEWSNGKGAVTWGNGATGTSGIVSTSNSLYGTSTNDHVGFGGLTALANGNYVVDSFGWNNGAISTAGAVTWANGTTGTVGLVSAANSLVGSSTGDSIGEGGVTALANGNYVVDSYSWSNGGVTGVGAVTFGNGTNGLSGAVTAANSLVGTSASDQVGSNNGVSTITPLPNGGYVVVSGNWHNLGAFTFGNGATGVSGAVSLANSVLGQTAISQASPFNVTFLSNANGTLYATVVANGSDVIYRGSTSTGFTLLTNSGPSIGVASFSGGLANSTGTLDLGTAILATSVAQTITVTNGGNTTLLVQPVVVPSGYSVLINFAANQSIPSGASASFTLQLDATTAGTQGGVVTIPCNDLTASPFTFNVTGTVTAPLMVVQQGATTLTNGSGTVTLGSTVVGTKLTQDITITNSGNAPLVLASASLPLGFSIVSGINFTTGQSIAVGSSATFTLQLDATTVGAPSGVVTIVSNDITSSPFSFNVTGTVAAPSIGFQQGGGGQQANSGSLSIVSNHQNDSNANGVATVDLGTTVVGTPVLQIITVTNTGTAALIVKPVIPPAGFSVVAGTNFAVDQSIAAGGNASFTLQLDATVAGTFGGQVTIFNNDPLANPFIFLVTGVVQQTSISTVIQVKSGTTPLTNGTGAVIFNENSSGVAAPESIMVSNRGNSPLLVQPVTPPTGFQVVQNFTSNSISPGQTQTLTLQLDPNVTNISSGTLTIVSNDPTAGSFTLQLLTNHAPTDIAINPLTATLNLTTSVVVGVLSVTDSDSAQTFTYTIDSPTYVSGGIAIPVFSIDHGILVLAPGASNGAYNNVTITVTDNGGLSYSERFTIYISASADVAVPSSESVVSGTPAGVTIAVFPTFGVQVQDAGGKTQTSATKLTRVINVVSYQLGTGGDNVDFVIDNNGQLQTTKTLDAAMNNHYHITISSTNTITGLTTTYLYAINVVSAAVASSINHAPVGTTGTVTTRENVAYQLQPSDFGFTDPNQSSPNSLLAVKLTSLPSAGTLSDNGMAVTLNQFVSAADITSGVLVFTPNSNLSGGPFTLCGFRVEDNGGTANGGANLDLNAKSLFINVTPVNQSPVGTNATVPGTENVAYTFQTTDFGFTDPNDSPPNALLAVKLTSLPTAGTLFDNGTAVTLNQFVSAADISSGELTFTPTTNLSGGPFVLCGFQVEDNGGTANGGVDLDPNSKQLTINLAPVNQAPMGTSGTVTGIVNAAYKFKATDFGFTDPHDSPPNTLLAVKITSLPTVGTLADNGVGVTVNQFVSVADINASKFTFTSTANLNGGPYALCGFQVEDNGGTANGGANLDPNPKQLNITYLPMNHAPIGTSGTVTGVENTIYTITTSNFGFTDPNDIPANSLLAVKIALLSGAGTLTDNGVAVTVNQFVSVADINTGKLKFTPTTNLVGGPFMLCRFQVQDNGGTANGGVNLDPTLKQLYINLAGLNHAPVGTSGTVTGGQNTAYTFKTTDFGFTDPNDSPANSLLAVKIALLPGAGTLTDNGVALTVNQLVSAADIAAGKLKFTPTTNLVGGPFMLCRFQVEDNGGTANGGVNLDPTLKQLYINLAHLNHAPLGTSGTVTGIENTAFIFKTSNFGFTDPNDSPANSLLAVKFALLPAAGTLTDNGVTVTINQFVSAADIAAGKLKFTPTTNLIGGPFILCRFQVEDNGGTAIGGVNLDPNLKQLYINLTHVNQPPNGTNGTVTGIKNTSYTFKTTDFGFTDPNDKPPNTFQAVKITLLPSIGTLKDNGVAVTLNQSVSAADISTGKFTFTPTVNLTGGPFFLCKFQVQDNGGTVNGGINLDPAVKVLDIKLTT